jgi:hypothetical protein
LPPDADGPVFLSVVWCHVSLAPSKAASGIGQRQFRQRMVLRLREWEAGRRITIGKIGVAFLEQKIASENVFNNSRSRGRLFWFFGSVGIATDGSDAVIFPSDQDRA